MGGILGAFNQGASLAEGSDKATNSASVSTGTSTTTSGLEISDAAVDAIKEDLLSGEGGLSDIFSEEKSSGIFNSSVAKEESGDLAAKIVGEIAKLRAKDVKTTENEATQETSSTENVAGLLDDGVENTNLAHMFTDSFKPWKIF